MSNLLKKETGMARKKDTEPVNTTEKNLKGLPFKKATDLKREQADIRHNIWRRFEEAKAIDEYSSRPEYAFWKARFKSGMVCSYGEDESELVKVFADDAGIIRIHIHEKTGQEVPPDELIELLVRAVSASFNEIYSKAYGVLPANSAPKIEVEPKSGTKKE